MTRVVYSLGSNLGDRLAHLATGVTVLSRHGSRLRVSPVYETAPVGDTDQGPFLNAVVVAELADDADLLLPVRQAEAQANRRRGRRWGPRTLDVDVVTVDDRVSADPELTLPHPRAHERAFVCLPWLDVEPAATLPGYGPVAGLLPTLDTAGVHRRDDLTLPMPR